MAKEVPMMTELSSLEIRARVASTSVWMEISKSSALSGTTSKVWTANGSRVKLEVESVEKHRGYSSVIMVMSSGHSCGVGSFVGEVVGPEVGDVVGFNVGGISQYSTVPQGWTPFQETVTLPTAPVGPATTRRKVLTDMTSLVIDSVYGEVKSCPENSTVIPW
jgi:hypothetical protein